MPAKGYCMTEIYEDAVKAVPPGTSMSGDVVLRLVLSLPDNIPFQIFADNLFTSLSLVNEISKKQLYYKGIFRGNKIRDNMMDEKSLKKMPRDTFDWRVNESNVLYYERFINLISTAVGVEPLQTVHRYDKKTNLVKYKYNIKSH